MDYYAYDEPIPGLTETGEEYTATQTIVMSEIDAVNAWRSMYFSKLAKVSDEVVLDEFITSNYAYQVYPLNKTNE